jgi:hypothetical protein
VILLLSCAHPSYAAWHGEVEPRLARHLGRLLTPRDRTQARESLELGPVAADNRAFAAFDARLFGELLDMVAGLPLWWVACPDVVGDAAATDERWREWAPRILERGLRPAYVLQNGVREIPADAAAVFVGGDDALKDGPEGLAAIRAAQRRGLPVHVGRVNTGRRIRYAGAIGADSFDGTKYARWSRTYLRQGLEHAASGRQGRLELA